MYIEKEGEILEALEGNLAYNYLIENLLPTIKDKVYAPRIKNPQVNLIFKGFLLLINVVNSIFRYCKDYLYWN